MSIELGTSRRATREASRSPDGSERVVDTSTSRIFNVAAATAIVGGLSASVAWPRASIRPPKLAFSAGLALLAGSGALSVVARRHLGRFHRDSLTVQSDHELVDTGPYGHVRHPLYTSTAGVFIGLGAIEGNWISVSLAVLPIAALVHRIRVEETMLTEALAESYLSYRKRTSRLLPQVW